MSTLPSTLRKVVAAEALPGYRLRLRFDDNTEGVIDLSAEAGKGLFSAWANPHTFASFRIEKGRRLVWSESLDLCVDALYLEVTGGRAEDIFPQLKSEIARA